MSARRILPLLLRQDLGQVDFGMRRFRLRPGPAREVLESSARSFLNGFNAAVDSSAMPELAETIEAIEPELRGFAYEGAGMACTLIDLMTLSRGRRLRALLDGPAQRYPHLVHVGAGWAFAKLGRRPWFGISSADPLLRWLAWDGFGFHQGFFHADRVVGGQRLERGLTGDQRPLRDQGLGRSLWFHECADPAGIALRIGEFPAARQPDLWSGTGLAASYAGGATQQELEQLADYAGRYAADLAQGCAFACAARRVSGIVPAHTERAALVLAGVDFDEAALWTDKSLAELGPRPSTVEQYQQWRAGIRSLWTQRQKGNA